MKWCLQEFFHFICACDKNHPSALSQATFSVRLCYFHASLCLLHSYLSLYFHLMYYLTLQMTILVIVPGKLKLCLQENLVDCADCGGLGTTHPPGKFYNYYRNWNWMYEAPLWLGYNLTLFPMGHWLEMAPLWSKNLFCMFFCQAQFKLEIQASV